MYDFKEASLYDSKLDVDLLKFKKKATNKAKLINRNLRKEIKNIFGDKAYIPYGCGKVYYEFDGDCSGCYGDCVGGHSCNSFGVFEIEINVFTEVYLGLNHYHIVSEAVISNDIFRNKEHIKYFNNIRVYSYNEEKTIYYNDKELNIKEAINSMIYRI